MSCPACGGEARRPISPGYWECTTQRAWERWVPAGPGGSMRPERGSTPCGHRYQDGATTGQLGMCACGTLAIGLCARCAVPVCGDHSWLRDAGRLCREHAIEADAETERLEAERRARAAAELRAENEWLREFPRQAAARLRTRGVEAVAVEAGYSRHRYASPPTAWVLHEGNRPPIKYAVLVDDGRLFEATYSFIFEPRGKVATFLQRRPRSHHGWILGDEHGLSRDGSRFGVATLEAFLEKHSA